MHRNELEDRKLRLKSSVERKNVIGSTGIKFRRKKNQY